MPEEVVYYVTKYGYLAIFILVFLQETGMPNPFPNELLLIFSGYLCFRGLLNFPLVVITVLSADFTGTNILYFLFYSAGTFILRKKPRWFPLSEKFMTRLTSKIENGGNLSIFIFRLTPFTRGYTSVVAGLLHIRPKIFLPIAFISALTWAAVYVEIGHLIGPSWNLFSENLDKFKYIMIAVLIALIFMVVLIVLLRKRAVSKEGSISENSHTS